VAQSGAWSCFDDIDQVAPDVISVMAVQIQILQMADSFRSLFRLAAITLPDYQIIISLSLRSQGFQNHQT